MKVNCPVSLGELVDKITILEIKQIKIEDSEKLKWVGEELNSLLGELGRLSINADKLKSFKQELFEINSTLWQIEDDIRIKEKQKSFDKEFVDLARSVYRTNDERFRVKNEINTTFGSGLREVKSYQKYD